MSSSILRVSAHIVGWSLPQRGRHDRGCRGCVRRGRIPGRRGLKRVSWLVGNKLDRGTAVLRWHRVPTPSHPVNATSIHPSTLAILGTRRSSRHPRLFWRLKSYISPVFQNNGDPAAWNLSFCFAFRLSPLLISSSGTDWESTLAITIHSLRHFQAVEFSKV